MPKTKIVLLARDCDSTAIVYNSLIKHTEIDFVIYEKAIARKKQFLNRTRLLGFFSAVGQVGFMLFIFPFIKLFSQKRKKEIYKQYHLDETPLPEERIIRVKTLNSEDSRKLLLQLDPDLVLVNGTRIISKKTLECIKAPFINIHTGITPAFRGVHGGYWAVAKAKKDLFGTTIHYVDTGVDTGGIIEQTFIVPGKKDNFYTYPYLQYAAVLPVLQQVVLSFEPSQRPLVKQPVTTESALWFHPTLWQWIKNLDRTFAIGLLFSGIQCFS